jgi:hypothetical protein
MAARFTIPRSGILTGVTITTPSIGPHLHFEGDASTIKKDGMDYFWMKHFSRVADRTFEIWNAHYQLGNTNLSPYAEGGFSSHDRDPRTLEMFRRHLG